MEISDKEQKLQKLRLRMNRISIVNCILQTFTLGAYAWAGSTQWSVVLAFFLASGSTTVFFAIVIASGWNLRFRDRGLLVPQLAVGSAIQIAFLVIEPKLWIVFLLSFVVTYAYAMIRFSPRQFTGAWLAFAIITAVALYAGRDRFGYPGTSGLDIFILWLYFCFAIRSLTLICAQFSYLRDQLSEKNKQLLESVEKINALASHDDLTGAYNRRSFMLLLAEERARTDRSGQMFWVAILDLDHFKSVNDRFGHLIGDDVLRMFCQSVQSALRSTDRFARYGGEEFVVLLTATVTADAAAIVMERIRLSIQSLDWSAMAPGLAVTVSAGITSFRSGESVEELLGRADAALYEAKDKGRNCVVFS